MAWDKPIAEAIGGAVKAFLQKPFTADTLLRALHKVLAGK
jgi:DNA-binding NarL/FixJ family response regulator